MLVNRMMMKSSVEEIVLPGPYLWATDEDFSGTTIGAFKYIGTKEYIAIPEVIKGVDITSYYRMFQANTIIKGVMSFNPNINSMSQTFFECSTLTNIELLSFDTSSVTTMAGIFSRCSSLTSLDLSSFNMTNVSNTDTMFYGCNNITTAYAKTQLDANKLNASSSKPTTFTFVVKP